MLSSIVSLSGADGLRDRFLSHPIGFGCHDHGASGSAGRTCLPSSDWSEQDSRWSSGHGKCSVRAKRIRIDSFLVDSCRVVVWHDTSGTTVPFRIPSVTVARGSAMLVRGDVSLCRTATERIQPVPNAPEGGGLVSSSAPTFSSPLLAVSRLRLSWLVERSRSPRLVKGNLRFRGRDGRTSW